MTADRLAALVPGDEIEATTRATYAGVLEMSVPTVHDLASRAPTSAADTWPPTRTTPDGPTADLAVPPPPAPRTTVAAALEEGWLVSAPPDQAEGSGEGPLTGLTVAVKDLIDVAGLPTRNGTPRGAWRAASTSAPVWRRLAASGAACVGKAALHEMAWGVTSPALRNPLDPSRYTGGSSGGSAAAVAAGVCGAALGTDTGGSIRVPAALCGLVGLRPTHGLLPLEGITALAPSQDVVGPIAPDVATCAAVLGALLDAPLPALPDSGVGLRVGVLADPGPMDGAVAAAYDDFLDALRRAGVELVHCHEVPTREAGALSVVTMLVESAAAHASTVHADPLGFGGEARALLTLAEDLVGAETTTLLRRARTTLRADTASLYDQLRIDAFLTPTTSCVAPRRDATHVPLAGREVPVTAALSRHTAWSAATGWPAVSVPVPTPGPLPAGMQLMARPHQEHLALGLGSVATTSGT